MPGLPKRDTVVGWAFVLIAFFLIDAHDLAIDRLFHMRAYSVFLFPDHLAFQYFFMGFFILALLPAAGLCCVTGWGVAHQRPWSRWTGSMPCLYLLLGFPYLTAVGLLGLGFLWTQSTVKQRELTAAEYWSPSRQSGWMITASILGWFVARQVFNGLQRHAFRSGLPIFDSQGPGILTMLLLMWLHTGLHECGHALAARWVGFRVKVLAIGPLLLSWESGRCRAQLRWRGLLLLGGYMGSIPAGPDGFREKQIAVIAAGPLASLLSGALLFAISRFLPDSAGANSWQIVTMAAVIGFYIGIVNLLPLGYCDGTILLHLLRRTKRGDELIALILRRHTGKVPEYCDQVAQRRAALQQLLASPSPDLQQLARDYITLGSIEAAAGLPRDAEHHATQGLALLVQDADPTSEGTAWSTLQALRTARYDHAGAMEAYGKALTAAQALKSQPQDAAHRRYRERWIADMHLRARDWDRLLETTTPVLADCPGGDEWRLWKGMLLRAHVHALLQTGQVEAALQAADEAVEILRVQPFGIEAPHHLGLLAESFWQAGRTARAVGLATECISLLEARGALTPAADFRLYLAELLRSGGQAAHAGCILPQPERITPELRIQFHERRGAIRRRGGKLPDALADLSVVVALLEQQSPVDPLLLAVAKGKLADALAEAGDWDRSEQLATEANRALAETEHPDFAATCITLAATGWHKNGTPGTYVKTAIACWNQAKLLYPGDKARELEDAARTLESTGLPDAAAECRAAAEQQWQHVGAAIKLETTAVSTAVASPVGALSALQSG